MKLKSLAAGFVVLALGAALIAGCAAPVATPTPTHKGATPSPTPTAASAAGSRVPVGCAGLFPAPDWQAIAGATAKVDQDENTSPTNLVDIAQLQYGVLSCTWDGIRSAAAPGSLLNVEVVPDATAAFNSRFAAIMTDQSEISHPAAAENVAGDKSGFWCANQLDAMGADFNLPICDAEMLVAGYWVSIEMSNVNELTRAQLSTGMSAVMTAIATKLKAEGEPLAQWPGSTVSPPTFCTSSTSLAAVRSTVGDSTLVATSNPARSVYATTVGLVGSYAECGWHSSSYGYLNVSLLAGGSWALPTLAPQAPGDADYGTAPYVSVPAQGVTSDKVSCADGTCDAFLAVGTSAVEILYNDPGVAKNPTVLAAFAKVIAAS